MKRSSKPDELFLALGAGGSSLGSSLPKNPNRFLFFKSCPEDRKGKDQKLTAKTSRAEILKKRFIPGVASSSIFFPVIDGDPLYVQKHSFD